MKQNNLHNTNRKMKSFIKTILCNCILCVISLTTQGQTYTTTTYNLKGKVKSVTSQAYQTQEKNGKIVEGMKRSVQIGNFTNATFSPRGLMEEMAYNFDGTLIYIGLKYNSKNLFIEKREWSDMGWEEGKKYLTAKFEYDVNGLFSKITQFYGTSENDYVTYTYKNKGKKNVEHRINDIYFDWDDYWRYEFEGSGDYPNDYWFLWHINNGQAIEMNYYYANDTNFHSTLFFEYDAKGKQLKQYPKTAGNNYDLNYVNEYKYDNNGRRTHRKRGYLYRNEADSIETQTSFDVFYKYDSKGRLSEKQTFVWSNDSIMPSAILKIHYTEKGKTLEYSDITDTKEYNQAIEQYNIYGDLIRVQCTYPENSNYNTIENYKYTYDEHKNWIKVLTYINGEPQIIVNRKIVYYE